MNYDPNEHLYWRFRNWLRRFRGKSPLRLMTDDEWRAHMRFKNRPSPKVPGADEGAGRVTGTDQ